MTQANKKSPKQVFRFAPWTPVASGVAMLVFVGAASALVLSEGWTWLGVLLVAMACVAVLGFVDALTTRVELHEQHMVLVRNLRRTAFPRSHFVKATWAKGVAASLQTVSGTWLNLPGVGRSSQGLASSLRAWIQQKE